MNILKKIMLFLLAFCLLMAIYNQFITVSAYEKLLLEPELTEVNQLNLELLAWRKIRFGALSFIVGMFSFLFYLILIFQKDKMGFKLLFLSTILLILGVLQSTDIFD